MISKQEANKKEEGSDTETILFICGKGHGIGSGQFLYVAGAAAKNIFCVEVKVFFCAFNQNNFFGFA